MKRFVVHQQAKRHLVTCNDVPDFSSKNEKERHLFELMFHGERTLSVRAMSAYVMLWRQTRVAGNADFAV